MSAPLAHGSVAPDVAEGPQPHSALGDEFLAPLDHIVGLDPCNARSAEAENLDTLVATIREDGLLHPLILRARAGVGFLVLAGGRRWQALRKLAIGDAPGRQMLVPARVFAGDDAAALELSIAENIGREPLHPLDEAERFAELAASRTVDDIARHYGVVRRHVRQRLALGRLSPRIRDLWRRGALDEAQARAFAFTADHAAQEALLRPAGAAAPAAPTARVDMPPAEIRARLQSRAVRAHHPSARFIGADAYREAGGAMTEEDLFDDGAWFLDGALLERLVEDRLNARIAAIRADEGWGFGRFSDPYSKLRPVREPDFLADERERLDALRAKLDALPINVPTGAHDAGAADALLAEIEDIERAASLRAFSREERIGLGFLLTINPDGVLTVERGLAMAREEDPAAPEDRPARSRAVARAAAAQPAIAGEPPLPAAARRIADAAVTHVIRDLVAGAPDEEGSRETRTLYVVFALMLSSLALGRGPNPVGLERHHGPHGAKRELTLKVGRAKTFRDAFAIALASTPEDVFRALIDAVASSIDCRGRDPEDVRAVVESVAAVHPDFRGALADAFDHAAYFRHASRAVSLAAIRELGGEGLERNAAWKRDDALAETAALIARARRWLPEWLRVGDEPTPALERGA